MTKDEFINAIGQDPANFNPKSIGLTDDKFNTLIDKVSNNRLNIGYIKSLVKEINNAGEQHSYLKQQGQAVINYHDRDTYLTSSQIASLAGSKSTDFKPFFTQNPDLSTSHTIASQIKSSEKLLSGYKNALYKYVDDGHRVSVEDIKKDSKTSLSHQVSDNSKLMFQLAQKFCGLGKDPKTPTKDTRGDEFNKRVSDLISQSQNIIKADSDGRDYAAMISNLANLAAYYDIDNSSYQEMMEMIKHNINSAGQTIDQERLNKLESDLENLNKDFLHKVEDLKEDEGKMWKWRLIQLLSLMSPVGPLAIFGEVLNWVAIFESFGPLFEQGLTFGESVGNVMSTFTFGLSDILGFDKVAEFFFDMVPLIKDPFELFTEIRNNEVVAGALDISSDIVVDDGIFALGLVGTYNILRLGTEINHHNKSHNVEKDFHKEAVAIFRKFNNSDPKNLEASAQQYARDIIDKGSKFNQIIDFKKLLTDSIKKSDNSLLNDLKINDLFDAFKNSALGGEFKNSSLNDVISKTNIGYVVDLIFESSKENQDIKGKLNESIDLFYLKKAAKDFAGSDADREREIYNELFNSPNRKKIIEIEKDLNKMHFAERLNNNSNQNIDNDIKSFYREVIESDKIDRFDAVKAKISEKTLEATQVLGNSMRDAYKTRNHTPGMSPSSASGKPVAERKKAAQV